MKEMIENAYANSEVLNDEIEAVVDAIADHDDEYVNEELIEAKMQNKGYSAKETLFLLIQSEGQGRIERKDVMFDTDDLDSGIYYSINNS
ncbi:hypothetical protein ACFR99_18810 [Haloarchaeobius amylolyticus]|uniref:Uncharacterized protein n=1 Tax=Haloarchaeobius amylolyticus TaxID=1198296 RepID=A0ABD6BLA1_9EURY